MLMYIGNVYNSDLLVLLYRQELLSHIHFNLSCCEKDDRLIPYVVISAILEYINKLKHPFTDRVQSRHVCWDKIYRIFVLIPAFKIRNRVWNQIMIAGIVLSYHRNVCMKLATSLLITLLCTIHKQRKQPAYTSTYWYFFSIPGVGMWSPGCAVGFPSSTPVFSKANIDDIENDLSIFQ